MTVSKVYYWLTRYYHLPVTAEDLAFLAKMSYSDLKYQFQRTYSIDVWDYLRDLRLSNAKYLLAYTPFSIREVARRVGYSLVCLETNFLWAYCVTPQQYREHLHWDKTLLFDELI